MNKFMLLRDPLCALLGGTGSGGGGGGMSAGYVVVEDNGVLKAQKLSFDGTTPQFDGVAEEITDVGIFETGLDEPAYNGGNTGGACKFYKCASVDTENKTWTGYEAYQDAIGIWTFSDTEMSLTYGDYFTPVVGKLYDATASIVISTLFDGIITQNTVFLLNKSLVDLSENNIQVVDKGLTVSNTGIMCTENGYAEIPAYALPSSVLCDNKDWTFEIKFRCTDAAAFYSQPSGCALYGSADEPLRFDLLILRQNNDTEYNVNLGGYGIEHVGPISYITSGDWLIHKVTHSSANEFKSYFNSEVLSTNKYGKDLRSIAFPIGCAITQGTVDRPGYPFEIEYIKISNVIE